MDLKQLYVLDLDGTLFKSDAQWAEFRTLCASEWGIAPEIFNETYKNSKLASGAYDINAHLRVLGLEDAQVRPRIESLIAEGNFIFDDVVPFFETHTEDELVILTLGVSWFQRAKIASIPVSPDSYRIITTLDPKKEYITAHSTFEDAYVTFEGAPYKSMSFVDNIPKSFFGATETPHLLTQYRLRRNIGDDRYSGEDTPTHITQITSLAELS